MTELQKTLIDRDGLTPEEALSFINDTRQEVYSAIEAGDFDLAEDIFTCDFGLELDYIMDLF